MNIIREKLSRAAVLCVLLIFVMQAMVLAAAKPTLSNIRFGSGVERDRIVFDFGNTGIPSYDVKEEQGGLRVILTFAKLEDAMLIKPPVRSSLISKVEYKKTEQGLKVIIDLKEAAEHEVKALKKPSRVYINFSKQYEREERRDPAPGLELTTYRRKDGRGLLTAYLLDVDTKQYKLSPVLANGEIVGRDTVSGMSDSVNAAAAVNASYFAKSGEILGMLRINGTVVGTTYFTRSALGIKPSGAAFVAPVYYDGKVTIGNVTQQVSGVNSERGENGLVIYNRYYDTTTGTNAYGREFIVRNGRIADIRQSNSPIPKNGYVISAHGTSRNAFAKVRIGDPVTFTEDLGAQWGNVPTIIGAGPTLVKNGEVNVTSEDFPGDITRGRAPRTGAAVLKNGHMLLAVVDGRQESSIGCTLEEFAELLVKFGAQQAVNFDGGGSSEMVVGGEILNSPSDGSERKVGSALAVFKK